MHWTKTLLGPMMILVLFSCGSAKKTAGWQEDSFAKSGLTHSEEMLQHMLPAANEKFSSVKGAYPRTIKNEKLVTTSMYDWTPGFFPGSLWYAYEYSKKADLKAELSVISPKDPERVNLVSENE